MKALQYLESKSPFLLPKEWFYDLIINFLDIDPSRTMDLHFLNLPLSIGGQSIIRNTSEISGFLLFPTLLFSISEEGKLPPLHVSNHWHFNNLI